MATKQRTSKGLADRLRVEGATALADPAVVDAMTGDEAGKFLRIPLEAIHPNPDQPRKHFDQERLEELAESIKARGVLQPLIVKRLDGDSFLLVAGERRYRASHLAGLEIVPAILTGDDVQEIALIENLQREDLNPLEEAQALLELQKERGYTQERLSAIVGKSRVSVTEILSLNALPDEIKEECRTSDIAKKSQLLQVVREKDPARQLSLWESIKTGTVTVKDARKQRKKKTQQGRPKLAKKTFEVEDLGAQITVTFHKSRATREEYIKALQAATREAKRELGAGRR